LQHLKPAYVSALLDEISYVTQMAPKDLVIHTIYFGGGTPSLLSSGQVERILAQINRQFAITPDAEITLEANPGSLELNFLRHLRSMGINRISLGMQSAHPDDLRVLERRHDTFQVIQSLKNARQAGFENISLDLIFGIPGQNLERWRSTLKLACMFDPQHISIYSLTIEEGTPLNTLYRKGTLPLLDEDLNADMYEAAMDELAESGYFQYEISNWAKKNKDGSLSASRHNLQYWMNKPYIGVGAGGHGSWLGYRLANKPGIVPYIQSMRQHSTSSIPGTPATEVITPINSITEMEETMMVGLRLTEAGVSNQSFLNRFGKSMEEVFGEKIRRLVQKELLEWVVLSDEISVLRLTRRGRLLGNQVFREFV
jgi:oxygen-independent coproporphyrinogen III oxidase